MNELEEIQKIIKNFVNESKQTKQQITEIERKRTQLAQERNEKKYANTSEGWAEISVLGKQISELGNQSQGLQNKLDMKFNEVKKIVDLTIDNLIVEEIRKLRKIVEERQELEERILLQKEKNAKYEMQKQEFYKRFGRMPELFENAKKEDEVQDRQCLVDRARIEEIEELIENAELGLEEFAKIKGDFKNRNWSNILESGEVEEKEDIVEIVENIEETTVLPLINEEIKIEETEPVQDIKLEEFELIEKIEIEEVAPIEEIKVKKFEPIEEIQVEEFETVEEIQVEKFEPLEEMHVEELEPTEEIHIEELEVEPFNIIEESKQNELIEEVPETLIERIETTDEQEQKQIDEIEELARAIIEEIVAEQTKNLNIDKIEEQEIITFEEKEEKQVKISAVEENITLSNIIAKIEDGEVVYKAQISNGEEIKVYPANLAIGNALLNDKGFREEIKEVLINYAVAEYKTLDKKVIKKIDPTVCEVLNRFALKYNYDARNLIYNYAMSFSKKEEAETDTIPIIYNFSYIGGTNLSKKEKETISKICKNAVKNARIDVIGSVTGLGKIKYMLKRLFVANNANALPEGKY